MGSSFSQQGTSESDAEYEARQKQVLKALQKMDLEAVLIVFYQKYNPTKVHNVPEILRLYAGEEIHLLQEICTRYSISQGEMRAIFDIALGTRPLHPLIENCNPDVDFKRVIVIIYSEYNLDNIERLSEILRRFEGNEHYLFHSLIKCYEIPDQKVTALLERSLGLHSSQDAEDSNVAQPQIVALEPPQLVPV